MHHGAPDVGARPEPWGATRTPGPEVALRIVVADNDADALDLALTDLRLEGHQVWGAPDARGAEALAMSVSPDVVVLDYRMPPGEDGLTLAERLVGLPSPPRVVIYSNYQSADLRARAAALGVPFLAKGNLRALRRAVAGT
jgi:CheY-like chemotaxis protein